MIAVDYVIIAVIGLSAVLGLLRGFLKEAISLATWVLAIWAGFHFAPSVADLLQGAIESEALRLLAAGAGVFIGVLVIGGLVNLLVSLLVRSTGLSGTDRLVGALFGAARGMVIVALLLVILAGILPLREESWWSESRLIPYHERLAVWIEGLLPEELAQYMDLEEAPIETLLEPET